MLGAAPLVQDPPRATANNLPELALEITDYAALPMTGSPDGAGNNAGSLARLNVMREEPGGLHRFFVNDLTGPLYILDRKTRKATTYLDFNGRGARTGLFDKLPTDAGLASGFISFEFDPDYGRNGRFYTIHLEEIALPGALVPDNASVPGLKVAGYTPTTPIPTPGAVDHEGVIVEWTDSNVNNATFEGTARELMRIPLNGRIHPLGDLSFNPVARRGDPDWRVLYVACGDGGSGDQKTAIRLNPQRLDTVVGKVLRIVPDLSEHKDRSVVSDNGRYRVPRDNPFVSVAGARPEIWAYGLRNPHRLGWDVDPARPSSPNLIATVIGFHTWETVDIIHRGANYGFPDREGTQMLQGDQMTDLPQPDTLPVHVTDSLTKGTVTPTYPVLSYGHGLSRRGRDRRRVRLSRHRRSATLREIHLRRHLDRPALVLQLQRHAGCRRRRGANGGGDARAPRLVGRSDGLARSRQAALSHAAPDCRSRLPLPWRQTAARYGNRGRLGPCRPAFRH